MSRRRKPAAPRELYFAGYTFDVDATGNTSVRRPALPPREPGKDYGADPIGDGTFRMVPSGDVVSFEERTKRLAHLKGAS